MQTFNDYKEFLIPEKAEILQQNHDFFLAWMFGHHHMLRHIWLNSSDSISTMIGEANLYTGYHNVTRRWIAASPAPYRIKLSEVMLHYLGDVAIVTSKLDLMEKKPMNSSSVANNQFARKFSCTNIFVRDRASESGRYRLIAHLGSDDQPRRINTVRK